MAGGPLGAGVDTPSSSDGRALALRVADARRDVWRWLRSNRLALGLGTLAAFVTWPGPTQLRYGSDLDSSWMYALQEAAHLGLRFGPGIVWTYGPLGYLGNAAIFVPRYGLLAVIALGVAWLLLAITMTTLAMRSLGIVAVAPVTLLLLFLAPSVDVSWLVLVVPLLVLWVVPRLLRDPGWSPPAVVGVAVLAVALFFTKATAGIEVLAVAGTAIVLGGAMAGGVRAAARNAAWLLGGLVVVVPALWVIVGQPLGNLRGWLSGYLQITTGYSSAMGTSSSSLAWQYPAALFLVVCLVFCIVQTPNVSRLARVVLAGVVLLGLYVAFRASFTRQTGIEFFVAATIVPVAFATRWPLSRWLTLALAGAVALAVTGDLSINAIIDVPGHVGTAVDAAHLVVSRGYRASWLTAQATRLRSSLDVPPEILARVGSRTVDVLPVDAALAFVDPSLRWHPLPVFQDYGAYTQELDDRNAVVLAGSQRPDDIIREAPVALDGRSQRFESPHENLEILCRYHVVLAERRWQLLTVRKDSCGAVKPAATIAARFGTPVRVPASSTDVVLARLSGVGSSVGDAVRAALLRGPAFDVSGDRGGTWYRFLPGTQQSWHIVSWPTCATPDLLNLGSPFRTLTMSNHLGPATTARPYEVQFATIPYACSPAPRDVVGG